jgi:HlyD family secretion protein
MVDIPRKKSARKRQVKMALYAVVLVGAVGAITFGVSRLKPAAPSVESGTLLKDTVKRGTMLLQVRGNGTLVPEEIRVVAAATQGRVERVLADPGTPVSAGTVLYELSNAELQQSAVDAEYQLRAAEADLNNLRARLESERLTQQSATAQVHAEYEQAKLQSDTDEALAKDGLIPPLNLKLSRVRAAELANRYSIEQKRLDGRVKSDAAQIASQQARISQQQALLKLKQDQVATLFVRAGTDGVLQERLAEVGQEVTPGTVLARVAEQQHLKAQLKIAETQIKDIVRGQRAEIDTRNGIIPGYVSRIDPAAQNGTFTVDVALDGPLPASARPELSVDGTIEQARLDNVLYVGRPSFGQANSTIGMFKVEPDGREAVRVQVKIGHTSVSNVEILDGLKEGDQVILSDTQQYDAFNRIRLN